VDINVIIKSQLKEFVITLETAILIVSENNFATKYKSEKFEEFLGAVSSHTLAGK
jgi:hypothetical protein